MRVVSISAAFTTLLFYLIVFLVSLLWYEKRLGIVSEPGFLGPSSVYPSVSWRQN